jgi:hypothetical protein
MSTEVMHGPNPRFGIPLAPGGPYRMTIEGHDTTSDGLTAAGVTSSEWVSARPAKRQAELLGMRTGFIEWFLLRWVEFGGTFEDAVHQIRDYPFDNHRSRMRGGA